jgi:hypothetical protein
VKRSLSTIAAVLLFLLLSGLPLLLLAGCKHGKGGEITDKRPVPAARSAPSFVSPPREASAKGADQLHSGDDWRAEVERLRGERDTLARLSAENAAAIASAAQREEEARSDEERAAHRREAALGKWLAGVLAILSVVAGVVAWTPWGWWLPKWAGPAGLVCSSCLLVLAALWPAANDHALGIGMCLVAGCLTVAAIIGLRLGLLTWIRGGLAHDLEHAETLEDLAAAKAKALAAEIRHGVHAMGQAQRRKPTKGLADLARLRAQAKVAA